MPVLGVTQILSWGTIFYTPVLIVPLIAAERGWSIAFAMGGFSVGLLTAGLGAPYVGRSIDRFGGHVTMTVGSLIGALGLVLIVHAANRSPIWRCGWCSASPWRRTSTIPPSPRSGAFSVPARAPADHRADARRRLCLDGELADDAFPARRRRLARHLSRLCRACSLSFRAAARLGAAARARRTAPTKPVRRCGAGASVLPPHGLPFILVASAFAAYAFVPSGLSAHLLAIFARSGIDAGTVVWIGALFGPAQVGARG